LRQRAGCECQVTNAEESFLSCASHETTNARTALAVKSCELVYPALLSFVNVHVGSPVSVARDGAVVVDNDTISNRQTAIVGGGVLGVIDCLWEGDLLADVGKTIGLLGTRGGEGAFKITDVCEETEVDRKDRQTFHSEDLSPDDGTIAIVAHAATGPG